MPKSKKPRSPLDFYPTPQPLCDAAVAWLKNYGMNPRHILEPSCGTGNWIRACRAAWPRANIIANDINQEMRKYAFEAGATGFFDYDLDGSGPHWVGEFDLIIGNPPYNKAQQHIERCIPWLTEYGILLQLLRINFLGAAKRLDFWRDHPANFMKPIVPRPDYTGDGGDSTEYALYGWARQKPERSYLKPHLTWEKPSKRLPRRILKAA